MPAFVPLWSFFSSDWRHSSAALVHLSTILLQSLHSCACLCSWLFHSVGFVVCISTKCTESIRTWCIRAYGYVPVRYNHIDTYLCISTKGTESIRTCASLCPCFAADQYHSAATLTSLCTPSPLEKRHPRLNCATGWPLSAGAFRSRTALHTHGQISLYYSCFQPHRTKKSRLDSSLAWPSTDDLRPTAHLDSNSNACTSSALSPQSTYKLRLRRTKHWACWPLDDRHWWPLEQSKTLHAQCHITLDSKERFSRCHNGRYRFLSKQYTIRSECTSLCPQWRALSKSPAECYEHLRQDSCL